MAKNNNLTDFMTDLANAIREKKGTTEPINPQDFSAEIAAIETGGGEGGGGAVAASAGAINFRDYDGTILHSYSKDAFLALTEMPSLPSQQGLICQGWNYTLADAQSYVTNYGKLEVGAMYITDDGKTRLYISVPKGRQDVPLYFSQTLANGVTIDWGDGSETQTLVGSGNVNTTHHYNEIGDYVISLDVVDGCTLGLGHGSPSYCVMGSTGTNGKVYSNMLKRAEIGKGVTSIGTYAFTNCYSLASIVIPQGVTSIGSTAISYCYSLSSLVIPQGVTSIGTYAFTNCYFLASIVIPQGVTSIGNGTFNTCYSLSSLVIPQGVTSIGQSAFSNCNSLSSLVIPQGVTSIGQSAFNSCYSLSSLLIPQGVTSIGTYAFYECYGMAFYDFRAATSVPSLGATNAFQSIPSDCKIVVPDALYDQWQAASNWSKYAGWMVKASEFNG